MATSRVNRIGLDPQVYRGGKTTLCAGCGHNAISERIYIVEQNRDAQMLQLFKLALTPARVTKLRSVLHYNGLPMDARSVSDAVLAQEGYVVATAAVHQSTAAVLGGE